MMPPKGGAIRGGMLADASQAVHEAGRTVAQAARVGRAGVAEVGEGVAVLALHSRVSQAAGAAMDHGDAGARQAQLRYKLRLMKEWLLRLEACAAHVYGMEISRSLAAYCAVHRIDDNIRSNPAMPTATPTTTE